MWGTKGKSGLEIIMKTSSQYRDLKPWVQKRAPMECVNKKKRKSEDWTLGCTIMWRPTEKEELAEVKGKWMECGIIWTEGRKSFKKKAMVNWYEIQLRGQITWEKRIYHHIPHQGNCGFVDYILHKDCGCWGEGGHQHPMTPSHFRYFTPAVSSTWNILRSFSFSL